MAVAEGHRPTHWLIEVCSLDSVKGPQIPRVAKGRVEELRLSGCSAT